MVEGVDPTVSRFPPGEDRLVHQHTRGPLTRFFWDRGSVEKNFTDDLTLGIKDHWQHRILVLRHLQSQAGSSFHSTAKSHSSFLFFHVWAHFLDLNHSGWALKQGDPQGRHRDNFLDCLLPLLMFEDILFVPTFIASTDVTRPPPSSAGYAFHIVSTISITRWLPK
jgi:hypothetical protein